jgi:hypothetical protein
MVIGISLTDVIILVGSCFAITHYLVYERGLFDVFHRLRYALGVSVLYDSHSGETVLSHSGYISSKDLSKNGLVFVSNHSTFAEVLSCHRCTAVWVTFGVAVFYYLFTPLLGLIPLWFGLCGLTVFMLEVAHK